MKERLISAFFGLIVFFAVILSDAWIMTIAITLITVIALLEAYSALGSLKKKSLITLSLIVPIWLIVERFLEGTYEKEALFVYAVLLFTVLIVFNSDVTFAEISKIMVLTLVISVFFGFVVLIRQGELGIYNVWMVFICAWMTDSGAYFSGRAFGKHKLCPDVSPKKTVEGAIGGIVTCVVSMLIFGIVISHFYGDISVNFVSLSVLGAISSIFAQLGDLSMSCVKRDVGVKDFGKIMPGHGGVLDRFDSIMFVAPLCYYLINIYPPLR